MCLFITFFIIFLFCFSLVPEVGGTKMMTQSSVYDDPADLEKTMDDVVDKILRHDDTLETPRTNVIVNDVEISHSDSENEESVYTESDYHGNDTGGMSNLKRFGAFESLDKLNNDDDIDGGSHRDADNVSQTPSYRQEEDDKLESDRSLVNRTLDQTIDEVDVEVVKINGSFGFSVQVNQKRIICLLSQHPPLTRQGYMKFVC